MKVKTIIKRMRDCAEDEIKGMTDENSPFSCGLSSEGFSGGYVRAMNDVLLLMNGVYPTSSRFWRPGMEQ
jgi:hypothetical protein